ncbi:hypothetical protein E6R18_29510 [Streptomyces sp. A1277]|nr:hypothetical protein E6R18_29510 [Streptomyces sp. A1277]
MASPAPGRPALTRGRAPRAPTWRILSTAYQGITRRPSFYDTHVVRPQSGIFLHRVDGGRARFLGLYTAV